MFLLVYALLLLLKNDSNYNLFSWPENKYKQSVRLGEDFYSETNLYSHVGRSSPESETKITKQAKIVFILVCVQMWFTCQSGKVSALGISSTHFHLFTLRLTLETFCTLPRHLLLPWKPAVWVFSACYAAVDMSITVHCCWFFLQVDQKILTVSRSTEKTLFERRCLLWGTVVFIVFQRLAPTSSRLLVLSIKDPLKVWISSKRTWETWKLCVFWNMYDIYLFWFDLLVYFEH